MLPLWLCLKTHSIPSAALDMVVTHVNAHAHCSLEVRMHRGALGDSGRGAGAAYELAGWDDKNL